METLAKDAGAGEIGRLNSGKIKSDGVRLNKGFGQESGYLGSVCSATKIQRHIPTPSFVFIHTFLVNNNLK